MTESVTESVDEMDAPEISVSVIILNYNTKQIVLDCLESVFSTIEGLPFEVYVVDNASVDGSVSAICRQYNQVNIIENKINQGFAKANNLALKIIRGKYALLLNSDTILTKNAVKILFDFMESKPQAGIACGQLLNRDGSKQNSSAGFPNFLNLIINESVLNALFPGITGKRSNLKSPVRVDSCIGASILIRTKAIKEVNYFDESFFFFFEETDLAFRMMQVGWPSYIVPDAHIYHLQGKSVGHSIKSRILFYESRYIYFKKRFSRMYIMVYPVVLIKLFVNIVSNSLICFLSLFMCDRYRKKLMVYLKLLLWHIKGCPKIR